MSRTRRGRGEGGVYRRADGRWCGSASVGYGDDGKRRRRTVYGKTKAEAVAKLDAVRQDVRAGVPVDPVKGTVGDFLAFWLADDVKPNRAPGTHKCYADAVRLHVNPHVGGVRLADLDAAILVNLYATLARAGVGARTREIVHVVLRRALRKALDWGKVRYNAAAAVGRPTVPPVTRVSATAAQAHALLAAAAGHRLEALFVVAVATGLRQGELFGLAWADTDLPGRAIHVRHSLEELNGALRLKEPKSARSRRAIDLPAAAATALALHRGRADGVGSGPVFADAAGGWLRKSNFLRRVYRPLLAAAGLPAIPFHGWRHFHATYQIELGTDPRTLQERLGHADMATTLRFYVQPRRESHRKAADAFDAAFAAERG